MLLVADNFERADSNTLGANWTSYQDSLGRDRMPEIVSKKAGTGSLSAGTDSHAVYTGAAWTGGSDQWAECCITKATAGDGGGPIVRGTYSRDGSNTTRAYLAFCSTVGSSAPDFQLYRIDDALTFVAIGAAFTATVQASDTIRIEAQGSTIRYLINGVVKRTVMSSVERL